MQERMKLLIDKYVSQDLTEAESQELDQFIDLHPMLADQLNQLADRAARGKALRRLANINTEKNLQFTLDKINRQETFRKQTRRISVALGIFLVIAAGFYLLWPSQKKNATPAKTEARTLPADIGPGGNKAILTLNDGKRIRLDSIPTGPIQNVSEASMSKQDSGTLLYAGSPKKGSYIEQSGEGVHTLEAGERKHILEAPRAGIFKVILPDGTKVWLNNDSRLEYPVSFTGAERKVSLTGEAYFEAAKNSNMPFVVEIGRVSVKVLGTRFNIKAYRDEKEITTTLLEGKVTLDKEQEHYSLKPGDQGIFTPGGTSGEIQIQHHVNIDTVMAWKENDFYFSHADLLTVLRQLTRWYDVDVKPPASPSNRIFDLKVKRSHSLTWLLDQLQINFKLEGKKLIVLE
ncbi:MAG TPA: FecR domain-containing protein [Puia sp.]